MITLIDNYGYSNPLSTPVITGTLVTVLAVVLAFYVLRSIGLYTLAKKNGIDKAFISWIPFIWIYIACKLAGNARIFNTTLEKMALYVAILFGIAGILSVVAYTIAYLPLVGYYLQGGEVYLFASDEALSTFVRGNNAQEYMFLNSICVSNINYPYKDVYKVADVISVLARVSNLLDLITTLLSIVIFINLFKRFWPDHFILGAVLSIMGLFAPFIFAVRKNASVNYNDYVRSKFAEYGNPYGNPNGRTRYPDPFEDYDDGNNAKNSNGTNNGNEQDPFEEFSDKNGKN